MSGTRVTGTELRSVRKALDVDPFVFAAIMGVHVSSIYRWESLARRAVGMNSLQRLLVAALVERAAGASQMAVLGARIREELVFGGPLAALYAILTFLKEPSR